MNKTEMLADHLREIAREYKCAPRTLNQAADMIENQARNIELLQVALEIERQNHDRLQDWDRGMTEKLASAELQCKQVNEGAAIVLKRCEAALEELAQVKAERDAMEGDVRKFCREWWETDARFPCHFCKHESGELCHAKMSGDGCCAGSHFEWRGAKEET